MRSSGRSSAERLSRRACQPWRLRVNCRRAAIAAFACLLGGLLPAPAVAEAASPEASGAMAECRAESTAGDGLTVCLETMEQGTARALQGTLARAVAHFSGLDAITGDRRAGRALAQGQMAFELYRDLDCELVELGQGVDPAAGAHRLACRIDHDRARLAALAALLPEPPPTEETTADAPATAAPDEDAAMIQETTWRALAIDGEPVADGVEITLELDEAAAFAGLGGCNRYFGTVEVTAERITFGQVGATRMGCPEPAMSEEQRYFQALEAVTGWRVEDDVLELLDDDGAVRVRLERTDG
jgi:heat shock protein HslJ/uncharacterized protein YecT (DUF1311 family)